MLMNKQTHYIFRTFHSGISLVALLLLIPACGEDSLIVGDARGMGGEENKSKITAADQCSEEDEWTRLRYNEWTSARADAKELVGHWVGDGPKWSSGPLNLFIRENGETTIRYGVYNSDEELIAPIANEGFVCGQPDPEFDDGSHSGDPNAVAHCIEGSQHAHLIYPVHDISLSDGLVFFSVTPYGPWDAWCQLQTSYPTEDQGCEFAPYETIVDAPSFVASGSMASAGVEGCTIYDKSVDCDWFALIQDAGVCQCTSGGCFANIERGSDWTYEYRLSEDGRSLLNADGEPALVQVRDSL